MITFKAEYKRVNVWIEDERGRQISDVKTVDVVLKSEMGKTTIAFEAPVQLSPTEGAVLARLVGRETNGDILFRADLTEFGAATNVLPPKTILVFRP